MLDGHTFRALSPEERAAFGGQRTKPAKARPVYLTRGQVVARLIAAGYPAVTIEVLARHARRLAGDPALAESVGAVPDTWEWLDDLPAGASLDDLLRVVVSQGDRVAALAQQASARGAPAAPASVVAARRRG